LAEKAIFTSSPKRVFQSEGLAKARRDDFMKTDGKCPVSLRSKSVDLMRSLRLVKV
jgi:hypothetical protein